MGKEEILQTFGKTLLFDSTFELRGMQKHNFELKILLGEFFSEKFGLKFRKELLKTKISAKLYSSSKFFLSKSRSLNIEKMTPG